MEKEKDYHKIINRLFILIGVGLLVHVIFLLYTIDPKTFTLLYKIKWPYLVLITFLAICPWLGHAYRIVMWSKFLEYPIGFRTAFGIVMANDLGAAITPTAVGGGPIKLGMLVNKGMPAPKATFMVLLSATEDIIFYGCGIALTFVYMQDLIGRVFHYLYTHSIWMITFIALIVLPIVFRKKLWQFMGWIKNKMSEGWQAKLDRSKQSLKHYFSDIGQTYMDVIKTGKWRLLLSVLILFFQWFTKFTILAIILISLGIEFTWFDMYIKQWIIWMGMLVIPTPGASGGAEAAFLLLFKDSMSGDLPNLIVSTWRFFTYYFVLIISVVLFNLMNRQLMKKDLPPA
ncbi:MAG: flippase-like domain-containing protein [Saprospiraceae bacterium]|nr:flippase-like domain-containing protein [Saprospiraceae bacterium]